MMRRPVLAGLAAATLGWAGTAAAAEQGCLTAAVEEGLVRLQAEDSPLAAVVRPSDGGQLVGLEWRGPDGSRRQLLYRGMNFCPVKGWDGKAPILWPATGRSFAPDAGNWVWRGKRLSMPIHGFARNKAWQVVKTTDPHSIKVRLQDDAQTWALYPFGFTFDVTYHLIKNKLVIEHHIAADPTNSDVMPFSIGNHMTFAVLPTATVSAGSRARFELDPEGQPTGRIEPIAPLAHTPIGDAVGTTATPLTRFDGPAPALVLEQPGLPDIAIHHWSDRRPEGDPVLFNLWGKPDEGYFSPEPWIGRQDSLNSGAGLFRLAPGEAMRWTVEVAVGGLADRK